MKRVVILCLLILSLVACTQAPDAPEDPSPFDPLPQEEAPLEDKEAEPEPVPEPTPTGGGSGRIAYYVSSEEANPSCDIRVVDVMTGNVEYLTAAQPREQYRFPRWSPSAGEMAMLHGLCCEGYSVSFLQLDDLSYTDMFPIIDYIWPASYAPDGGRVVFSVRSGGEINLFIMDRQTGEWTQVTQDAPGDIAPDWHPFEDKIVFAKNTSGFTNIAVINADGSDYRLLTNHSATSTNPRWSPDGSRIVFESDLNGNDELYIINADGSGMRNITSNPVDDKDPAWSPDGTHIAFASFREPFGIYILNVASGEVTFLAESGRAPDWAP